MPSSRQLRRVAVGALAAAVLVPVADAPAQPLAVPCIAGQVGDCTQPAPATAPAPAATAPAGCADADLEPTDANVTRVRRATLCLLNRERASRHRSRLRRNRSLERAAQRYAHQMVAQSFFAHVSPTGTTFVQRIRATDYLNRAAGWSLGENLAWGEGERATPRQMTDAWMHSAPHRRNILDRQFREIGIGVQVGTPSGGRDPGATYATEFGKRVR
jgi:uncharacterized protein YkwD